MNRTVAMKPSLFRSGLAPRLIAAAIFGVLAFGAVLALDRTPLATTATPASPVLEPRAPARASATLCPPAAPGREHGRSDGEEGWGGSRAEIISENRDGRIGLKP